MSQKTEKIISLPFYIIFTISWSQNEKCTFPLNGDFVGSQSYFHPVVPSARLITIFTISHSNNFLPDVTEPKLL